MAFHRWASDGSAGLSRQVRASILRLTAAEAPRISRRTMIQVIGGFFLAPGLPAWRGTTTVAGPAWESSALACHARHALADAAARRLRRWSRPEHNCPLG